MYLFIYIFLVFIMYVPSMQADFFKNIFNGSYVEITLVWMNKYNLKGNWLFLQINLFQPFKAKNH